MSLPWQGLERELHVAHSEIQRLKITVSPAPCSVCVARDKDTEDKVRTGILANMNSRLRVEQGQSADEMRASILAGVSKRAETAPASAPAPAPVGSGTKDVRASVMASVRSRANRAAMVGDDDSEDGDSDAVETGTSVEESAVELRVSIRAGVARRAAEEEDAELAAGLRASIRENVAKRIVVIEDGERVDPGVDLRGSIRARVTTRALNAADPVRTGGFVLDACPHTATCAELVVGAGVQFSAVVHVTKEPPVLSGSLGQKRR